MNAPQGDSAPQSGRPARRLPKGRRGYLVGAVVVAIWLLVALVVALATASGVVWF